MNNDNIDADAAIITPALDDFLALMINHTDARAFAIDPMRAQLILDELPDCALRDALRDAFRDNIDADDDLDIALY
jgi:hypothetical protein